MKVRTRFAPSPTGYLHIGGVRTALFNWFFAKRYGGQFVLRIDDTDEGRHVAEALQPILDGFRWLGVQWDEGPEVGGPFGPYFQSQRRELHIDAVRRLIQSGHAYPDLTPPAEVDAAREVAKAAKRPFVYRGKERDMDAAQALAIFEEKKCAVRFRTPTSGTMVLQDHVRGTVEWQNDLLGDFTICRHGGVPLYNLASIVDDIGMEMTHIIRAEEHLTNTHTQLVILEALGAPRPEFAHIPFVAEPGTKKKISKRNPPKGVKVALAEYKEAGYLPSAIINAMARLGWSLDDHSEIIPLEQVIAHFSLDRIVKSPAGLDPDKIFWMQDHYMRHLASDERIAAMVPFLQEAGLVASPPTVAEKAIIEAVDRASGDRLKLLADIVRYGEPFLREELEFDADAVKNLRKPGVAEQLEALVLALTTLEPFEHDRIEAAVKNVATELGVGGKINHTFRAALTGRSVGPGVFDCAVILGRDRSVHRLRDAATKLAAGHWASQEQPAS